MKEQSISQPLLPTSFSKANLVDNQTGTADSCRLIGRLPSRRHLSPSGPSGSLMELVSNREVAPVPVLDHSGTPVAQVRELP